MTTGARRPSACSQAPHPATSDGLPVTTVAVVGAGQLGMMLAQAGADMGVDCRFLDPAERPPAGDYGDLISAAYDDADALRRLAEGADVVTYEFENVPVGGLRTLPPSLPVFPPAAALEKAQDRLAEKQLFESLDIPTASFRNVASTADAEAAAAALGLPLVFKTRRFGYDGKGQQVVRHADDLHGVYDALGAQPLIAEQLVNFDRELSIIGARRPGGESVHWPLSENRHEDGILRVSTAPFADDELHRQAVDYHRRLLQALDYSGVLTLEMFAVGRDLVANEIAPRVHNSGHWTIEGSATSQFANHLNAVLDRPLGPTDMRGAAAMVNLIGRMPDAVSGLSSGAGVYLHDYGKSPRPGRKLGHVTLVCDDRQARDAALAALVEALSTR